MGLLLWANDYFEKTAYLDLVVVGMLFILCNFRGQIYLIRSSGHR